jgi:hypothetical protein
MSAKVWLLHPRISVVIVTKPNSMGNEATGDSINSGLEPDNSGRTAGGQTHGAA